MGTLNVEKIKTNIKYVYSLIKDLDILCIQEHWLYNFEEPILKTLLPDFCYHIKCRTDMSSVQQNLK